MIRTIKTANSLDIYLQSKPNQIPIGNLVEKVISKYKEPRIDPKKLKKKKNPYFERTRKTKVDDLHYLISRLIRKL